jgi:ADP-heptose:LPS heptosyltransferase
MALRQTPILRRVCVARFGAIGDLLMTTPTLRALHRLAPNVEIDYVVGRGLGDVLSGLPMLRRVIEFDKKADAKPARMLAFAAGLRRERYDLFLNLQRSVKTVLLAVASGAPRVLTYERRRAPLPDGRLQHTVDNFLDTLQPLGIDPARADRHLDFFIPDAARERVDVLLGEHVIGPREPLVVLNPGRLGSGAPLAHRAHRHVLR